MARAVTKCPNCGTPVSQFAAGCAICGADLVAVRREREQRHSVPSSPLLSRIARIRGQDAFLGGLLIVAAFASPLLGGLIAGLFAYQAHNDREIAKRNLCLVAVAIAVLMIILISLLPGAYNRLLISLY